MEKQIYVSSRQERDEAFKQLKKDGYQLLDFGYHWDLLSNGEELVKVIDVRM